MPENHLYGRHIFLKIIYFYGLFLELQSYLHFLSVVIQRIN